MFTYVGLVMPRSRTVTSLSSVTFVSFVLLWLLFHPLCYILLILCKFLWTFFWWERTSALCFMMYFHFVFYDDRAREKVQDDGVAHCSVILQIMQDYATDLKWSWSTKTPIFFFAVFSHLCNRLPVRISTWTPCFHHQTLQKRLQDHRQCFWSAVALKSTLSNTQCKSISAKVSTN